VRVQVFWADNPRDLQLLRHDKSLHTIKTKPHLRNVPDYLGLCWTRDSYTVMIPTLWECGDSHTVMILTVWECGISHTVVILTLWFSVVAELSPTISVHHQETILKSQFWTNRIHTLTQSFYGHYTGQPVLAVTPS